MEEAAIPVGSGHKPAMTGTMAFPRNFEFLHPVVERCRDDLDESLLTSPWRIDKEGSSDNGKQKTVAGGASRANVRSQRPRTPSGRPSLKERARDMTSKSRILSERHPRVQTRVRVRKGEI